MRIDYFTPGIFSGATGVVLTVGLIVFGLSLLTYGTVAILDRRKPSSHLVSMAWVLLPLLVISAVTVVGALGNHEYEFFHSGPTVIEKAANKTYDAHISYSDAVALTNAYGDGSENSLRYIDKNDTIPQKLVVYGSTKIEGQGGRIIDITLISRHGEYEIVSGDSVYAELPKR
jgi:hypothetical protein